MASDVGAVVEESPRQIKEKMKMICFQASIYHVGNQRCGQFPELSRYNVGTKGIFLSLQRSEIITIPGFRTIRQVEENVAASECGTLSIGQIEQMGHIPARCQKVVPRAP